MIVNKDFRKRVDFVMRQGWKNIEKMYNNEASKYDVTFSIGFKSQKITFLLFNFLCLEFI